jgi:O-antigen/teichoic acid export membrane protein
MRTSHTLAYMAAKIFAAAMGLLTISFFTRLLSPEGYGIYVLVTSVVFVAHAFAMHGLFASFFEHHVAEQSSVHTATLVALCLSSFGVLSAGLATAALTGLLSAGMAAAMVAMLAGLAVFEGALVISRTRLQAGLGSLALVLRPAFVLVFGVVALTINETADALVLSIGLANAAAGAPVLFQLRAFRHRRPDWKLARRYLTFGWPLVISSGTIILGQYAERFVLAGAVSPADLGRYGAIGDVIRQTLIVPAEAITMSMFSFAKRAYSEGDGMASESAVQAAYVGLLAIVLFGGTFFLIFGADILTLLLGPEFREGVHQLVPLFVLGYGLLVLRVSYFSQAIFFGCPPRADLLSGAAVLLLTVAITAAAAPSVGVAAGAIGVTVGQLAGCAVLLVAYRRTALPVPMKPTLILLIAASFCLAAAYLVEAQNWPVSAEKAIVATLFGLVGTGVVWSLDVIGLRSMIVQQIRKRGKPATPAVPPC